MGVEAAAAAGDAAAAAKQLEFVCDLLQLLMAGKGGGDWGGGAGGEIIYTLFTLDNDHRPKHLRNKLRNAWMTGIAKAGRETNMLDKMARFLSAQLNRREMG